MDNVLDLYVAKRRKWFYWQGDRIFYCIDFLCYVLGLKYVLTYNMQSTNFLTNTLISWNFEAFPLVPCTAAA